MSLEIKVDCTEQCFDLPEWKELLARDPDRHVFATPEWCRLWWEEFGDNKDLYLLTMHRDGDIVAIVPLYRREQEERTLFRFIGGLDLTDYLGPICSLDDRDEVASGLIGWLAETDVTWDVFDAHCLPVPFGFTEFLVDHADRRGLEFSVEQEEISARLMLPATWDDYLESLSSKDRHEVRRKRRRLERDHPDANFRRATGETLDKDLKYFIEMHRGAEGHKGHFMKPEIATFFERVARGFIGLGWLRLDVLEIAERPVASTFSFAFNNTFYLYNSAYEPEIARLSPGVVLVSELIKDSIEKGLKVFDFLRGSERYKFQLGGSAVPLHHVQVMNGPRDT